MPSFSIWVLRLALTYLLLGFTFGALLLFHKGVPLHPSLWSLLPAHIEFLLLGWTVQLIMGVAFWILPRLKQPPKRGNVPLAWTGVAFFNAGILLVSLAPLFSTLPWLTFAGRVLEVAGAAAFAVFLWPRVKDFRA